MTAGSRQALTVAFFATVPERVYAPVSTVEYHSAPWIVLLADALTDAGVVVHVVTRGRRGGGANRHYPPDGDRRRWHVWEAARRPSRLNVLEDFRTLRRNLLMCADECGAHLVHGHGTEYLYARAATEARQPFIISMQTSMRWIAGVRRWSLLYWYAAFWERRTLRRAHHLICKTEFSASWVRKIHPAARIFVIPNVISPLFRSGPALRANPAGPIVFVGTIRRDKGIFDLMQALSLCGDPEVKVVVCGNGLPSDMRRLNKLVGALGVRDRVDMRGHVDAATVAAVVRAGRGLVLPTYCDNSPNVVVEALLAGAPVLASRVGGIPELMEDGINGRLIDPGDVRALARWIARPSRDWIAPDDAVREAARSRLLARHDAVAVARQHVEAYRTVLAQSEYS